MQITPWTIYLIGIVDNVSVLAFIASLISAIMLVFSTCFILCESSGYNPDTNVLKIAGQITKRMLYVLIPSALVLTFTPSSKTLVLMYVLPAVANSEVVQKDFPELYRLALEHLRKDLSNP